MLSCIHFTVNVPNTFVFSVTYYIIERAVEKKNKQHVGHGGSIGVSLLVGIIRL